MTSKRTVALSAEPRKDPPPSLSSIGNGVVLAIIALSVLAQGLTFVTAWLGSTAGKDLPVALQYLNMAILPGIALAFVKLILMLMRRTWHVAAMYLAILLLPFLGTTVVFHSAVTESSRAAAVSEPESEEYLTGRDWARAHVAHVHRECQGTHEFNRGCRAAVSAMWHEKFVAGREWAIQHRPRRPSECEGELNFVAGCQGYLLEQVDYFERYKKPANAPPADYLVVRPTTTEECVREVNAVFETDHALHRQQGFDRDDLRAWNAELKGCKMLDFRTETKLLTEGYGRLNAAVEQLKAGAAVTDEKKTQIDTDHAAIVEVHDQPYRKSYLQLFEEYQARLSGRYREAVVEYPDLSCDEYRQRIDTMRALDQQRSDRIRALDENAGQPGVATDRTRLNQERIDMLWDWKRYTDGAKAHGCKIEAESSAR